MACPPPPFSTPTSTATARTTASGSCSRPSVPLSAGLSQPARCALSFPRAELRAQLLGEGYEPARRSWRAASTRACSTRRAAVRAAAPAVGRAGRRSGRGIRGRIAPEKNLPLVLSERSPRCAGASRGRGSSWWETDRRVPELQRAASRARLRRRAQRTKTWPSHYASADLFLFPSVTETFGNVTVEAMASGLAVVAYRLRRCARAHRGRQQRRTRTLRGWRCVRASGGRSDRRCRSHPRPRPQCPG